MSWRLFRPLAALAAALLACPHALATAFVNLDFTAGAAPPDTPLGAALDPATALPGWTARGPAGEALQSVQFGVDLAEGYAVLLQTPPDWPYRRVRLLSGTPESWGRTSIAQTGQVPTWANSLLFESDRGWPPGALLIDGSAVNTVSMLWQPGHDLPLYAADLRGYAGQTVTLTFVSPDIVLGGTTVANLAFSEGVVPEPKTACLIAIATVGLVGWRKWAGSSGPRQVRPRSS